MTQIKDETTFKEFKNPMAVIQAAVDMLNRDPDNLDKILMVCKIINHQANKMLETVDDRERIEMALKAN